MNKKTVESKRRYVLELSEQQASLLSSASELYARLGVSQFEHLDQFFFGQTRSGDLNRARELLRELSRLHSQDPRGFGPGIRSAVLDDQYRVAWDLYQVLRHRLAWDRSPHPSESGFRGVAFDPPIHTSREEPLAAFREAKQGGP